MMTQPSEVDGAMRPSDVALELDSLPTDQPASPLRVFISYKEKDQAATVDIKKLLLKIGGAISECSCPAMSWRPTRGASVS